MNLIIIIIIDITRAVGEISSVRKKLVRSSGEAYITIIIYCLDLSSRINNRRAGKPATYLRNGHRRIVRNTMGESRQEAANADVAERR